MGSRRLAACRDTDRGEHRVLVGEPGNLEVPAEETAVQIYILLFSRCRRAGRVAGKVRFVVPVSRGECVHETMHSPAQIRRQCLAH